MAVESAGALEGTAVPGYCSAPSMRCRVPLAWGLLLLLTWGAIEATCLGALWGFRLRGTLAPVETRFTLGEDARRRVSRIVQGREQTYPHDPLLGWTAKPGGSAHLYHANAQGIRADREYALLPPAGVLRIAAFGDSHPEAAPEVRYVAAVAAATS